MSLYINFNNPEKTKIEYSKALETEEYYNGASRRTLTFEIPSGTISIDNLNSLVSIEENISILTLSNENDELTSASNIYSGYVLNLSCGTKSVLIATETENDPAVYDQIIELKLGKRTYIEQQLKNLGL